MPGVSMHFVRDGLVSARVSGNTLGVINPGPHRADRCCMVADMLVHEGLKDEPTGHQHKTEQEENDAGRAEAGNDIDAETDKEQRDRRNHVDAA